VKDFSFNLSAFAFFEGFIHHFFLLLLNVLNYLAVLSHQEALLRMIFEAEVAGLEGLSFLGWLAVRVVVLEGTVLLVFLTHRHLLMALLLWRWLNGGLLVAWLFYLVVVRDEAQLLLHQVICSDLGLKRVLRALGFRGHSVRALGSFWLRSFGHQGLGPIVEFRCFCVLEALQTLRRGPAA
jgi:hypothetical protein